MKRILNISLTVCFILLGYKSFSQPPNLILQGVVDVWNEQASPPISLIDDFYYGLCEGDKLKITITGTANLAPRDEERKKGGFLGMFKKSYTVRIDNLVEAKDAVFSLYINDNNKKEISNSDSKTFNMDIPYGNIGEHLKDVLKLSVYVNQYRSPLRAGQYNIKVEVDSKDRIGFLQQYFENVLALKPTLSFKDIKDYVEAGKLIYRYPEEVTNMVNIGLRQSPNLAIVQKDLYLYLLSFAPNNTTIRRELANIYLKELNFSEAINNAKKSIDDIFSKYPNSTNPLNDFAPQDKSDLGGNYAILGGVDEQKELGLNENAYTKASYFFGESAKWFNSAGLLDKYSESIYKQVRCLQRINNIESLKSAAEIVKKQIDVLSTGNTN